MAREQVALAVRKNFNGAAVSETDVVVEMVYKVRHRGEFIVAEGGEVGVDGLLTMGGGGQIGHFGCGRPCRGRRRREGVW